MYGFRRVRSLFNCLLRFFLMFADLFRTEMLVTTFEMHAEGSSFSLFAVYFDTAVMQFYNTFGKSQTNTCSGMDGRIHLFRLIEAVEYLVNILWRNTCSIIGNFNDDFPVALPYRYGNLSFLFRIFKGIGQKIIHDLLQLFSIVPYVYYIVCFLESERYFSLYGIFLEE